MRERTKSEGAFGGGSVSYPYGSTNKPGGGPTSFTRMYDLPSGSPPYPDKGASYHKRTFKPGRYSGKTKTGGKTYSGWPYGMTHYTHCGYGGFQNWGVLQNEFLARLNPDRPVLDLPLFLWELRELPSLLWDSGNFLLRRPGVNLSDAVLAVNFGWAPLLSDLSKLFNLAEAIQARMAFFEKVARDKRIEVKLPSSSYVSSTGTLTAYLHGFGEIIRFNRRFDVEQTAWGVANLKSFTPPPALSDDSGMSQWQRANAALGLSGSRANLSTIWNMIPWSWLVDYFLSVGSWIEATGGYQYYDLDHCCLMQRVETRTTTRVVSTTNLKDKPTPGRGKSIQWERRVIFSPVARIYATPLLSGKQFTNLVALATSSRRRYSRS